MTKAYVFFFKKLQALKNRDVEELKRALLNSFYLVAVELEQGDSPYAIFEGLHTKGRAATQIDLLRSYFLARLSPEKQERAFQDLWHPMALRLSGHMPLFFEHFLLRDCFTVREGKFYLGDPAAVRAYNIYFTVKSRCDQKSEAEVMEYLETLARFSEYYAQFIHPETCPHPRLREALRASACDLSACRPFLLSVFEQLLQKTLREDEVVEIVSLLKKYMRLYGPDDISTDTLTQIFVWLDYLIGSDSDVCGQLKKWVEECESVKNQRAA